jgi:hypothetical protein
LGNESVDRLPFGVFHILFISSFHIAFLLGVSMFGIMLLGDIASCHVFVRGIPLLFELVTQRKFAASCCLFGLGDRLVMLTSSKGVTPSMICHLACSRRGVSSLSPVVFPSGVTNSC